MDFIRHHFHVLLYAGFWLSLAGYGLVAPQERVEGLDSAILREGWHITAMAGLLGGSVLLLYALRMSGSAPRHEVEPRAGEAANAPTAASSAEPPAPGPAAES